MKGKNNNNATGSVATKGPGVPPTVALEQKSYVAKGEPPLMAVGPFPNAATAAGVAAGGPMVVPPMGGMGAGGQMGGMGGGLSGGQMGLGGGVGAGQQQMTQTTVTTTTCAPGCMQSCCVPNQMGGGMGNQMGGMGGQVGSGY